MQNGLFIFQDFYERSISRITVRKTQTYRTSYNNQGAIDYCNYGELKMTTYQGKTGRKLTGAKLKANTGKKKRMLGRAATQTGIGEEKRRAVRVRGGNTKFRLFRTKSANVVIRSTGKTEKTTIKDVKTNPASREYSRRRIITKGAILDTELGDARVTNHPGKEGFVNAVLLEDQ